MTKSPPGPVLLVCVITLLVMFAPMTIDMYLPALPTMAIDLGSDAETLRQTLSVYILGFGAAQIVYGPLSDAVGRRPALFAACALYAAASVGCALAESASTLIVWRFVEALGAAGGPVVGRAVVRDFYAREKAASVLAWVATVMAVAPVAAPALGGAVVTVLSWRAIFWILAGFGVAALLAVAFLLPESNANRDVRALRPAAFFGNYRTLVASRTFMGFGLGAVFLFNGLFAFFTQGPFVLVDQMGLTPVEFGLAFGAVSLPIILGAQYAARRVVRVGLERICRAGTVMAAVAGLWVLVAWLVGWWNPLTLLGGVMLYFAAMGLAQPVLQAGAISPFPRFAGAASSLVGVGQYFAAGGMALAVDLLPLPAGLKLSALMASGGLCAAGLFWGLVWRRYRVGGSAI
ncbi:MAG: multidrug effflux MFS transporter [Alphaproteobacteria bacterium]